MPLKPCPCCTSRKKLQKNGIETSVRPNPTLVCSVLRFRFVGGCAGSLARGRVRGSARTRAGAREHSHEGGCAGALARGRVRGSARTRAGGSTKKHYSALLSTRKHDSALF